MTSATALRRVFIAQHKAIKVAFNLMYRTPSSELYTLIIIYNILDIISIKQIQDAIFTYMILSYDTPMIFLNIFHKGMTNPTEAQGSSNADFHTHCSRLGITQR